LTCVANDYGWDEVFARGVEAYGKPGDILVLLSTSGNSPNVVKAAAAARRAGMKILSLLGKTGGALQGQGDLEMVVPGRNSDRIQEIHMQVLHILIEGVEREMFPENYAEDAPAKGTEPAPAKELPLAEEHPRDWAPRTATDPVSRRLRK